MARADDARRILLVEDDADDRARIHRLLRGQRRRYDITDAGTGGEAVALLSGDDVPFDAVLLDRMLPDMDGEQVLRALVAAKGRVPAPVSMLTGHDDDAFAATVLELGAEDYLLKDAITPHALMRSIENVAEKYEIRRQLESQRAAVELRNARLETVRSELESRLTELSAANHARDRFVAMMSHEMRTPLNAILGYAELLELEIEGQINASQRRNLDRIRVGSRHLLDLINDVLDLARADARKLELDLRPVNANAVVEEIAALLENQAAQKGLTLSRQLDASRVLVSADLQRLRQILTNLIANAIKFTEHGTITIASEPVRDGEAVAITVTDTGIGIAPDDMTEVFKEFFQADNALTRPYGGSGLGLAISQRLARAMGGDIAVESTPGEGSRFTLTMRAADTGSEVRPEDSAQLDARMARHREQLAIPQHLRADAVPVVAFADDAASLAALERQVSPAVRLAWTTVAADVPSVAAREKASLVILDISSEKGSAWRVAHSLAEMDVPVPPAILLLPEIIARADAPAAVTTAVDLGWVALVPKPFTSEQLTRAVTTAAGRSPEDDEEESATYEVMVIDDDDDSRRVASRFLREKGIKVRECVDGEHGLVEMRIRPPDVVVLDLMMPVLDGFGVLATMRADLLLASVPVVVLTAKTLTDAERQFLTRTAVRVLQKGEHRLADIAALVLRAAMNARAAGGGAPLE